MNRFASRFVYTTCYTFPMGWFPEPSWLPARFPRTTRLFMGSSDGAHAAVDMVEEMRKRKLEAPSGEPSPAIGQS